MLVITNQEKSYYKLRQLFYYKLGQSSYKLRQALQIKTKLLHIKTAITNFDRKKARNLGIIFDKHLFMSSHVNSICSSASLALRNIGRVGKY